MAEYLTGGVGVIYIIVGLIYLWTGKYGLGVAFISYALANVGLILAAKGF
jgi:hypothetical protein